MIRTSLKDQRLFLSSSTDANSSPSPPPSQMYPSSSQSSAALLRFYLIIRPPRPFHAGCRMEMRPIHFFRDGLVDVWVEGDRDPRVEAPSPGLHWVQITSTVGGCKPPLHPGRQRAGLVGVFSNLAIVSEGLFFGLLSHYAVMVAIFCFGICPFCGGGNTCQKVFESSLYHK